MEAPPLSSFSKAWLTGETWSQFLPLSSPPPPPQAGHSNLPSDVDTRLGAHPTPWTWSTFLSSLDTPLQSASLVPGSVQGLCPRWNCLPGKASRGPRDNATQRLRNRRFLGQQEGRLGDQQGDHMQAGIWLCEPFRAHRAGTDRPLSHISGHPCGVQSTMDKDKSPQSSRENRSHREGRSQNGIRCPTTESEQTMWKCLQPEILNSPKLSNWRD